MGKVQYLLKIIAEELCLNTPCQAEKIRFVCMKLKMMMIGGRGNAQNLKIKHEKRHFEQVLFLHSLVNLLFINVNMDLH